MAEETKFIAASQEFESTEEKEMESRQAPKPEQQQASSGQQSHSQQVGNVGDWADEDPLVLQGTGTPVAEADLSPTQGWGSPDKGVLSTAGNASGGQFDDAKLDDLFTVDNRMGISGTLHRIRYCIGTSIPDLSSCIWNQKERVLCKSRHS